jgi:hypothetical protein
MRFCKWTIGLYWEAYFYWAIGAIAEESTWAVLKATMSAGVEDAGSRIGNSAAKRSSSVPGSPRAQRRFSFSYQGLTAERLDLPGSIIWTAARQLKSVTNFMSDRDNEIV